MTSRSKRGEIKVHVVRSDEEVDLQAFVRRYAQAVVEVALKERAGTGEWDPVLPASVAAKYCGGISTRALSRMGWERAPLPGTGTENLRWGYRLSVLNRELERLVDVHARPAASRPPKVKKRSKS